MQSRNKQKISRRIGVVGITAALVVAAGCGLTNRESSHEMPTSAAAETLNLPDATDAGEDVAVSTKLPVYWLENTESGVFLYREYLQDKRHQEPIGDAIWTLLSAEPTKPKRYTHLKPTDEIGVSINQPNVITLDLPAKVFSAHLDQGLSERAIQQLVFTATAAASSTGLLAGDGAPTVRILVDGQPNATVFDDYQLADVYERDPEFIAPIWIIDPQYGSTVDAGSIRIHGRTTQFDVGTFYSLQRKDADGKLSVITAQKQVNPGQIKEDGSFILTTELKAGSYLLTFWGVESESEHQVGKVTSNFKLE
ncbi:GerMN domain-containing protein [Glutamicibacter arilaitensis]|uniref:GerMN domain-containing protein n=1 Tax=Glutamicibacter arilaitensis TaxID=256701 RepID=UPI001865B3A6|nr:GerMN domain-containing protein [Glutamicibacter arilaitensis]